MHAVLLWGMVNVLFNGIAWCYELMPMVRHFKKMNKPKLSNGYNIRSSVIGLFKARMFLMDIATTMSIISLFGFGGGLLGGIIGLTISNVFSVFILANNGKLLKELHQ